MKKIILRYKLDAEPIAEFDTPEEAKTMRDIYLEEDFLEGCFNEEKYEIYDNINKKVII